MHSYETIDLGTYRGDSYFLTGFVEPDPSDYAEFDPDEDGDEYGVALARSSAHPLQENTQIVRMDTAHGTPHLDRVYLPPDVDEDTKVWLEKGYEYHRMRAYLLANWKAFVDQYNLHNE